MATMGVDSEEQAGRTLEDGGTGPGSVVMAARPHIFLVVEADRPGAGGARYALSGVDEIVIGRGEERSAHRSKKADKEQLRVRVPGRWMSSTHARITRVRGAWVIEDCGSRNGTSVNGERASRRTLQDGDLVEAGHTLFVIREALPTPKSTPPVLDAADLAPLSPGLRTLLPSLAPRLEQLVHVAQSEVPIVLLGETGTGKEVLARAAHDLSGRKGAFVAVNCGSLSPGLVEGLLFGHVRGSFSGALRDEVGFVRAADGGTLFLDEVGDFPIAAQPSLLRVLQEREVVPVGSSRPVGVRLRVVSATHRDVDALVTEGTFRRDLLMRLDGFRHALPPLRERREDIGLIVAELLARRSLEGAAFISSAARALVDHEWPGNVRELEQVIARALVLAKQGPIGVEHLGLPPRAPAPKEGAVLSPEDAKLRDELVRSLTVHSGNVTDVARSMGKARMQIQRWIQRFGIDAEQYRGAK